MDVLIIFCLVMNSIFIGEVACLRTCLTWDINQTYLSLTCRVNNIFLPVSFYDQHGQERAKCSFFMSKCVAVNGIGRITSHLYIYEIILRIKSKNNDFNGTWRCIQGDIASQSVISTSKGIISATDVDTTAQIEYGKNTKLLLTCFACREPSDNYVEILINNISVDSMHYSKTSKRCFHIGGMCPKDQCHCSPSGNEFMRIFNIEDFSRSYELSCQMKFTDDMKSYGFFMISTLFYDGKDIIHKRKQTLVPKPPETVIENDANVSSGSVLKMSFACFILLSLGMVCLYFVRIHIRRKEGHSTTLVVEETKLIPKEMIDSKTTVYEKALSATNEALHVIVDRKDSRSEDSKQENTDDVSPVPGNTKIFRPVEQELSFTTHIASPIVFEKKDSRSEDSKQENTDDVSPVPAQSPTMEDAYESISDTFSAQTTTTKDENTTIYKCGICLRSHRIKKSEVWCIDCEEFLCDSCSKYHQTITSLKFHVLVNQKSLPKGFKLCMYCKQHTDLKLDHLCRSHDLLCCKKCIVEMHRRCEIEGSCIGCNKFKDKYPYLHYRNLTMSLTNQLHTLIKSKKERSYNLKTTVEKIQRLKSMFEFILEKGSEEHLYIFIHSTKNELEDIDIRLQEMYRPLTTQL